MTKLMQASSNFHLNFIYKLKSASDAAKLEKSTPKI